MVSFVATDPRRLRRSFVASVQQYGDECWCGMSADEEDYKRHGRASCLAGCSGDPAVACGEWDCKMGLGRHGCFFKTRHQNLKGYARRGQNRWRSSSGGMRVLGGSLIVPPPSCRHPSVPGGRDAFNLFKFDGAPEPVAPTPEPVAPTPEPVAAPTPEPVSPTPTE